MARPALHVHLAALVPDPRRRGPVLEAARASPGAAVRRRVWAADEPGVLGEVSGALFVEYAGPRDGLDSLLRRLVLAGVTQFVRLSFAGAGARERRNAEGRLAAAGLRLGPVAPGVHLVAAPPLGSAVWLLEHGGEAAILESPLEDGPLDPALAAADAATHGRWLVRFLLASHVHFDHAGALALFRATFPEALAVGHASFGDYVDLGAFSQVFSGPVLELSLGGEPLLLVHAPKHSPEDVLVFFRGSCLSGDWAWGPYPDCNALVPRRVKLQSLDLVAECLAARSYRVHSIFSSHGDEARRDVDFGALLAETRAFFARG